MHEILKGTHASVKRRERTAATANPVEEEKKTAFNKQNTISSTRVQPQPAQLSSLPTAKARFKSPPNQSLAGAVHVQLKIAGKKRSSQLNNAYKHARYAYKRARYANKSLLNVYKKYEAATALTGVFTAPLTWPSWTVHHMARMFEALMGPVPVRWVLHDSKSETSVLSSTGKTQDTSTQGKQRFKCKENTACTTRTTIQAAKNARPSD